MFYVELGFKDCGGEEGEKEFGIDIVLVVYMVEMVNGMVEVVDVL